MAAPLRVTGSRPGDGGRQAWTVLVHNPAKVAHPLELSVLCARVDTSPVAALGTVAKCPIGTAVTGGGFQSQWLPRLGAAAVTGSYPVPGGGGWAVDVRGEQEIRTFALCTSQVVLATTQSSQGAGSASVGCPETLVGGGFQVMTGWLPDSTLMTVRPKGREWTVAVSGRSVAIRVTALCLAQPVASPALVAGRTDWTIPVVAVAGLVLVLLLLLPVTVSRVRKRAVTAPHVSVVLSGHRSAFRLNEMREFP